MSAEARARAAALEAAGDADGAAREYAAAGAHDEAARVFTLAMRPLDAAIALLAGIDMIGSDLEPAQRSRAQLAASLLREGGRDEHARLVLGAISGTGPAFPSAVLKSVVSANTAPAPRLSGRPAVSAPPADARRSGSSFVVRAPVEERVSQPPARASGTGIGSPFLKPGGPSKPAATPATSAPTPVPPRTTTPVAPAPSARTSAVAASTPSAIAPPAPAPSANATTSSAGTAAPVAPAPAPPPRPSATASSPGTAKGASSGAEGADQYRAEAGWRAGGGAAIEETIRQFISTGRKGAAARVAWEAGQFARALPWFVELGLKYQAGSCLRSLGRNEEALAMLLEVPMDDSRYRRACFDIVALAKATGRLDFEIDRFLTAFVGEGPKDASECEGFLELADLYAKAGFPVGARRCAEGVLRVAPDDARAKALATPRSAARPRSRPPIGVDGDRTALPSLDEFRALARKHAPPRPAPRR